MILLSRVSAIGVMLAGGIALQPARAADADDGIGTEAKAKVCQAANRQTGFKTSICNEPRRQG
jgi:hypothetical protein